MLDSLYGLNFNIQSFAVANEFVKTLNKACYKLGQELRPFCLYATDKQKEFGVVDFALFDGLAGKGSLIDEIIEYREGVFKNQGICVNTQDEMKRKLLFYNYLMSISICYVEIPKYTTREGLAMATYDKFLCTRNPAIMATWVGDSQSSMQAKYSSKIGTSQLEVNENLIRFVKLNQSGKGNTITMPRGASSVEKMTCVPLFMLYIFVEGFKSLINEKIVEFTYLKDNGTLRVLPTTLNLSILMDYYNDNSFVGMILNNVDINTIQQGAMMLSSKMSRGYIKVPELGASIYDGTGCRSLNIARLLSARVIDEVDRSYINVDLNSTVQSFKDGVDYILTKSESEESKQEAIKQIYMDIVGAEIPFGVDATSLIGDLYANVDSKSAFLSTQFHRSLHKYMVERPTLFPLYTGKPTGSITSSSDFGVETMDFL